MVRTITSFEEGCRRGLGIVVKCTCGKRATFRCTDFSGFIAPSTNIEELTWRCTWCRSPARYVRYIIIRKMERQNLSQWVPPLGRKQKWP